MHFNTQCEMFVSRALVLSKLFYLIFCAVVNVTFPDDKQNYIHRIGRVGRADR